MNDKTRIYNILSELGLSEGEISTYIELLRLGTTPASILSKRMNSNRSTCRYTLENLAKKRFVFQEEKNGIFYFTAEDPEKILLILQDEKEEIEKKGRAIKKIIGELKALKSPFQNIPKVRFFEGVDGIIKMYNDVLEEGKTIYGYSRVDETIVHPEILKYLEEVYVPTRIKTGNRAFMLYNDNISDEYLKNDKKMNRTTLKIPAAMAQFNSCFHIYGKKIAFYSRTKEDTTGVIIEHSNIQNDQLAFFKLAWEYAKTLPENKSYKNVVIEEN